LVQVSRAENPLENKGVRLTRLITFSLGPLLYTPFTPGLSVSKKLKEKQLLKELFSLNPEEGLIVRHWATLDKALINLFYQLRQEWEAIQKQLPAKPPLCVSPPFDLCTRVVRALSPSDTLVVDDRGVALRMKGAALYRQEGAFDERCEEAWESLFSPEIPLPQGGSLYIEETRGLVVIDVNSQGKLLHAQSFNHRAIQEALKAIRLRELGGKIVVDLIGKPKESGPLLQGLSFPSDMDVWGISPMGLLEMTRRRKRLSLPQRLKLQIN
jgi:Rne/Rng family ribonuclease